MKLPKLQLDELGFIYRDSKGFTSMNYWFEMRPENITSTYEYVDELKKILVETIGKCNQTIEDVFNESYKTKEIIITNTSIFDKKLRGPIWAELNYVTPHEITKEDKGSINLTYQDSEERLLNVYYAITSQHWVEFSNQANKHASLIENYAHRFHKPKQGRLINQLVNITPWKDE